MNLQVQLGLFPGALHLFTGCGNGYGTVGIAWRGGMCDKRGYNTGAQRLCALRRKCWLIHIEAENSFCAPNNNHKAPDLSPGRPWPPGLAFSVVGAASGVTELSKLQKAWLIFAHELGHNFGGALSKSLNAPCRCKKHCPSAERTDAKRKPIQEFTHQQMEGICGH